MRYPIEHHKTNRTPTGTDGFVSGKGFAYNAANLYHSLEYLHYETLNTCDMASANAQMKRMSFSADQALQAGLSQSKTQTGYVNGMDIAWRNATMFYQWLYRMESRHIMNNVVFGHDGLLPADDRYAALAKPLNEMSSLGDHFEYVFLMFFRSLHAHTHTHTHTAAVRPVHSRSAALSLEITRSGARGVATV